MKAFASFALAMPLVLVIALPAWSGDAPPRQPGVVRSDKISKSQVLLTWRDRSDNEENFEVVRRKAGGKSFRTRGFTPPDITSFVDTVRPAGVFIYKVRAHNEFGSSNFSNDCFVNRTPPSKPTPVRARLIALTVARITWGDRSRGETGFAVQRREIGQGFRTIVTLPPGTELYEDWDLAPARTFFYRVRALGTPTRCIKHSKFSATRIVNTKGGVRVLSVVHGGTGRGNVVSAPNGIVCGLLEARCDAEFPVGTRVTLWADANKNSVFKRWVGAVGCIGTKGPCTINMGKDREMYAVFKRKKVR